MTELENQTRTAQVETPSGKGAGDENFPVGSWLLPARLRPHVARFYAFARAIDDIADNPELAAEDKVARLARFEAAVTGRDTGDPALATGHRMRVSLEQTGVTSRHCVDLIAAFKQDAVKLRYRDWADLMGYCALSANPFPSPKINPVGTSKNSASSTHAPRGIRNTATRPASRPPPGRSARGWRTPSAWRWRSSRWRRGSGPRW